jgi:hypothetical protein
MTAGQYEPTIAHIIGKFLHFRGAGLDEHSSDFNGRMLSGATLREHRGATEAPAHRIGDRINEGVSSYGLSTNSMVRPSGSRA